MVEGNYRENGSSAHEEEGHHYSGAVVCYSDLEQSQSTRSDFKPVGADFQFVRSDLQPVRADLQVFQADFRDVRADLQPVRADLQPFQADFQDVQVNCHPKEANAYPEHMASNDSAADLGEGMVFSEDMDLELLDSLLNPDAYETIEDEELESALQKEWNLQGPGSLRNEEVYRQAESIYGESDDETQVFGGGSGYNKLNEDVEGYNGGMKAYVKGEIKPVPEELLVATQELRQRTLELANNLDYEEVISEDESVSEDWDCETIISTYDCESNAPRRVVAESIKSSRQGCKKVPMIGSVGGGEKLSEVVRLLERANVNLAGLSKEERKERRQAIKLLKREAQQCRKVKEMERKERIEGKNRVTRVGDIPRGVRCFHL